MSSDRMPAAFIGHGAVRNAWQETIYTRAWADFARQIPHPEAVLVISAHWYLFVSAVTAMDTPRTVHDFFGGTDGQRGFSYPCPGSPKLAEDVIELLGPHYVGRDTDSWGLDHGAWVVLTHMFPNADVPVVELAINGELAFEAHIELGSRLAPLRNDGVLVIASGNLVHHSRNLFRDGRATADHGRALDLLGELQSTLSHSPREVARIREHPDFPLLAPTEEHFIPVLYFAGLVAATGEAPSVLIDGPRQGAIGMTAFALGLT